MDKLKKLETIHLTKRLTIYIASAIILLLVITISSLTYINHSDQEKREREYNSRVDSSMHYVIEHFVKDYGFRVNRMVETGRIAHYLKDNDREGLYKFIYKKFDLMQSEHSNFKIMHIHKADGTSFLRVHRPDFFGDNIAQKRPMLREVHKTHKAVTGYETGLYSTAYRVISPIFDEDKNYIGALEIGINPNFIVEAIHKINGFCGAIFIKEDELKLHSIDQKLVIAGYRLQSDLNNKLKGICDVYTVPNVLDGNIKFRVGDKKYLSHLMLLKNFKNEDSVKIVFFQDITEDSLAFNRLQYIVYLIVFFILGILIWLIYRLIGEYKVSVTLAYKEQIVKLKRSEVEINKQQNYLQLLFDTIPNILISTSGKKIVTANSAMLNFFEYDSLVSFSEEHRCICDFFLREEGKLQAEMGSVNWLEYVMYFHEKVHVVAMKKNDKVHHFIVNVEKINYDNNERTIVSFSDITEMEAISKRLQYATEGTSDGLWDWDLTTNKVYFSPRWKSMLGFSDSELANDFSVWQERVHPDDLDRTISEILEAQKKPNTPYSGVHRLQHKDGHWVWILDRGQTIFDEELNAVRMVGFHTDISEIKNLEQELLNKEELMIAQSRHAAMGEMISMIAHQWRQPISVIAMDANNILADVELESVDDETLKSGAEDIIKQTQELSKTIDDFRNFFRPERVPELVYIQEILDDALGIIGKSLENNNIHLTQEIQESIEIKTYSRELMQVIVNIVKNAKEVILENDAENRVIKIISTQNDESLTLSISDYAGGIDKEIIKKIFDPYYTTKGEKNGTGLGLYMSKTIVEKHLNGKLNVFNIDGGARFEIKLPLELES